MRTLLYSVLILATAMPISATDKPRVFITDSKSWEISGGGGGTSDAFGSATRGGARPQTAEIIKTFGERCPDVTVNNKQDLADYVVLLDHEGGKSIILHDNKVAVFNRAGDSILSRSTRSLGNAVKDSCEAVVNDWRARGTKSAALTSKTNEAPGEKAEKIFINISSNSNPADIEIDGSFVGTTPSKIGLQSGQHTIIIKKTGYKVWERRMTVSSGDVHVEANLDPQ